MHERSKLASYTPRPVGPKRSLTAGGPSANFLSFSSPCQPFVSFSSRAVASSVTAGDVMVILGSKPRVDQERNSGWGSGASRHCDAQQAGPEQDGSREAEAVWQQKGTPSPFSVCLDTFDSPLQQRQLLFTPSPPASLHPRLASRSKSKADPNRYADWIDRISAR